MPMGTKGVVGKKPCDAGGDDSSGMWGKGDGVCARIGQLLRSRSILVEATGRNGAPCGWSKGVPVFERRDNIRDGLWILYRLAVPLSGSRAYKGRAKRPNLSSLGGWNRFARDASHVQESSRLQVCCRRSRPRLGGVVEPDLMEIEGGESQVEIREGPRESWLKTNDPQP